MLGTQGALRGVGNDGFLAASSAKAGEWGVCEES